MLLTATAKKTKISTILADMAIEPMHAALYVLIYAAQNSVIPSFGFTDSTTTLRSRLQGRKKENFMEINCNKALSNNCSVWVEIRWLSTHISVVAYHHILSSIYTQTLCGHTFLILALWFLWSDTSLMGYYYSLLKVQSPGILVATGEIGFPAGRY